MWQTNHTCCNFFVIFISPKCYFANMRILKVCFFSEQVLVKTKILFSLINQDSGTQQNYFPSLLETNVELQMSRFKSSHFQTSDAIHKVNKNESPLKKKSAQKHTGVDLVSLENTSILHNTDGNTYIFSVERKDFQSKLDVSCCKLCA